MNSKDNSPFTPGSPVPVELFEGRLDRLNEAMRYINQSATGRLESMFLVGERGIGKSSFAAFIRHIAAKEKKILGLHVYLGQVHTLDEMVRHIFEQLLKATREEKWFGKVSKFFGDYIKEAGLFGVKVSFSPPSQDLENLVWNFSDAILNVIKKIEDDIGGLFIALDDINGLAEKAEFANWYKSFADSVATSGKKFPVSMMLIGLPEKRDSLHKLQPSLMRIFRILEIEKLSNNEASDFFKRAFSSVKIKIKPEALDTMVHFSSGLPMFMHEIGDATYWLDSDNAIGQTDALFGIFEAADRIGKKYLDPKFYHSVRSQKYKSILRKLGNSRYFLKSEIKDTLNEAEKKVFNNFLRKLRDLGILELDHDQGQGAYKFVNNIYPVYIGIEARRSETKKE